MPSPSAKNKSDSRLQSLSDRLRNTTLSDAVDDGGNKPDFRELDLGSPISPLRPRAAASSSSSSSGSVSGRTSVNLPRQRGSNPQTNSGELTADSSPSTARAVGRGHTRSYSSGSHRQSPSGSSSSPGSASVTSPVANVLPAGNICPSGGILKPGIMTTKTTKTDVLASGFGHYGHGSIMRGGPMSKHGPDTSGSPSTRGDATMRAGASGTDPEEFKRLGNDSYRKGNYTEALTLYEKAIALSPRNASYRFNRSAALMALKRLVDAVKECEEAIRLEPGYTRAHHRLGSLFLSLGQVDNARRHIFLPGRQPDSADVSRLQSVEKHLTKCTDSRKVGDWRGALREVDAAIAAGADSSPQLFACRAESLLKLHKLDDAFLAMPIVPNSSPAITPQSPSRIFGMLGEAYLFFVNAQIELAMGRFDGALTAIGKAVQIDPRNTEISILQNTVKSVSGARGRGNELFKSERFTEACAAYDEGLRHDPFNSVLYCNRAACFFMLGKWERSIEDCNQALRIQPKYIKALLRRAASSNKLERWSEAVTDYEVLRRELPDNQEIAESLFHAQVALKKSRGEVVHNMKFGGEVETILTVEQFRATISSPSASVVLFKTDSNFECKQILPFVNTLCGRYPSVNFFKVDIEESSEIAQMENVRVVPTFKIYRKGARVKEMICPSPDVLESSVRHYNSV